MGCNRKVELGQMLGGYRYISNEDEFKDWLEAVWSWVEDRVEGGFKSGFIRGVRALESSAREEGVVGIPEMEDAGIRLASDKDWEEFWKTLGVARIDIGRV